MYVLCLICEITMPLDLAKIVRMKCSSKCVFGSWGIFTFESELQYCLNTNHEATYDLRQKRSTKCDCKGWDLSVSHMLQFLCTVYITWNKYFLNKLRIEDDLYFIDTMTTAWRICPVASAVLPPVVGRLCYTAALLFKSWNVSVMPISLVSQCDLTGLMIYLNNSDKFE